MVWGRRTSGEEEVGIQVLLDEALLGSPRSAPLKPLNLEMRVQRDFGAPDSPPPTQPQPSVPVRPTQAAAGSKGQPAGLGTTVSKTTNQPLFAPPGLKPHRPGEAHIRGNRPSHSIRFRALSAFLAVIFIGLGVLSFTPPRLVAPESYLENAARLHSRGEYQAALQEYARLRQSPQVLAEVDPARLAFLEAGAAESLWKQGIEPAAHFELALRCYDDAIQADQTPMRVYGSEALMAKAEMNVARALAGKPNDASAALTARKCLETLVEAPEYSSSPAVALGLAHRRLAELIRVENPGRAIDLLSRSKQQKGPYSEGLEDLLIAQIYRDILRDEDQAYDFFTLVKNNPSASLTNRQSAEEALTAIDSTGLHTPDVLDPENLDSLPQLKAE